MRDAQWAAERRIEHAKHDPAQGSGSRTGSDSVLHLILAPEYLSEQTYIGVPFILGGLGSQAFVVFGADQLLQGSSTERSLA